MNEADHLESFPVVRGGAMKREMASVTCAGLRLGPMMTLMLMLCCHVHVDALTATVTQDQVHAEDFCGDCKCRKNDNGNQTLVKCCSDGSDPDEVDLSGADIHKIASDDVFSSCHSVARIDFTDNYIQQIPEKLFANNKKLLSLYLDSNKIEKFPEALFAYNPELTMLSLSNNKIKQVPEKLFATNTKLTGIDLSQNKIQQLPQKPFSSNTELSWVDLSENVVEIVPEKLFASNEKLTQVDLSFNKIDEVPEGLFASNRNLTHVHLAYNKIEVVPEKLFVNNTELVSVGLYDNKINCLSIGFESFLSCPSKGQTLTVNLCSDDYEGNAGCYLCNLCSTKDGKPKYEAFTNRTCINEPHEFCMVVSSDDDDDVDDDDYDGDDDGAGGGSPHGGDHSGLYAGIGIACGISISALVTFVVWKRRRSQAPAQPTTGYYQIQ